VPRSKISSPPPDEAFVIGAKNAVVSCLGVRKGERLAIVTHKGETAGIAAALLAAAGDVGAEVEAFVLGPAEAADPRFVATLLAHVAACDASLLVSTLEGLPVDLRRRIVDVGTSKRRHGHMIGITPSMMTQSMRADYAEVERVSLWLATRLAPGAAVHATTPNGTDLEAKLDPVARVGVASGVLNDPGWTNLPGGEVFALPARVDGVFVPDGGVWLPDGSELPLAIRMKLTLERGEVTKIDGPADSCARLEKILDGTASARRVGQLGFGTNTGVLAPIGALLQDLKVPSFHLTLGHTCPEVTAASWDSDVEIPLLTRRATVTVDGELVLVAGRFPPAALA
jgi:leucyl aminopeptidase (aminopeptidase T)